MVFHIPNPLLTHAFAATRSLLAPFPPPRSQRPWPSSLVIMTLIEANLVLLVFFIREDNKRALHHDRIHLRDGGDAYRSACNKRVLIQVETMAMPIARHAMPMHLQFPHSFQTSLAFCNACVFRGSVGPVRHLPQDLSQSLRFHFA